MRRFGTQGPVHPEKNYVVSRATELADFVMRVKEGRYPIVNGLEQEYFRQEVRD